LTLLVTSSAPDEGKTVTSANLAAAFAQAGKRTIVVDADLARPSLHTFFGESNEGGLRSLFWGDPMESIADPYDPELRTDLGYVLRRRLEALLVPSGVAGLYLLPAGQHDGEMSPELMLPMDDMQLLLEALREAADVVIVDGPPVLAVADTAALATLGLGVLVVVEAGQTRTSAARAMQEALVRAKARLLGVVLNKATTSNVAYYNYYREYATRSKDRGRSPRLQRR
jgi:non-specific protein-tyrosine kinase